MVSDGSLHTFDRKKKTRQTYRDEFDTLAVAAGDMVPEVLGVPVRERCLVIRQARHSRPSIVVRSPEETEPSQSSVHPFSSQ